MSARALVLPSDSRVMMMMSSSSPSPRHRHRHRSFAAMFEGCSAPRHQPRDVPVLKFSTAKFLSLVTYTRTGEHSQDSSRLASWRLLNRLRPPERGTIMHAKRHRSEGHWRRRHLALLQQDARAILGAEWSDSSEVQGVHHLRTVLALRKGLLGQ